MEMKNSLLLHCTHLHFHGHEAKMKAPQQEKNNNIFHGANYL